MVSIERPWVMALCACTLLLVAGRLDAAAVQDEFGADTVFAPGRGFYPDFFQLVLTAPTTGAEILYTLDGHVPDASAGQYYVEPINISRSTVVRARARDDGFESGYVRTHSYLFLADIIRQPARPRGFPGKWGSQAADYAMDPNVVDDPRYRGRMTDSLLSLPTVSLVTDPDHLFDAGSGIYANPRKEGVDWERPVSVEWIDPDGGLGFQIDAGVRIQGNFYRNLKYSRKKSFRVLFKGDYGASKLRFPLFDAEGATDRFDTLVLRAGANDAYTDRGNWDMTQAQYIIDEFAHRSQLAMGRPASHGRFVHGTLNKLYWGLYHLLERPDASFCAAYFGGAKENWDVLNTGSATGDSTLDTWTQLIDTCQAGLATLDAYESLRGHAPDGRPDPQGPALLDVPNYIDYMLLNFWIGNKDWPNKNWYAGCLRGSERSGFKFFTWDAEITLVSQWSDRNTDAIAACEYAGVAIPFHELRENPEFRLLFGDHVQRHLFNGGALSVTAVTERYRDLANTIELAVIAETARWGDQGGSLYTLDDHWIPQRDRVLKDYMPLRTEVMVGQLCDHGLYPSVAAPEFTRQGGVFEDGFHLAMTASDPIYYSLDGTDPRAYGTGVPVGIAYTEPLPLVWAVQIKSRARGSDGSWSALNEAVFTPEVLSPLRVTEMMYHPRTPTGLEIESGLRASDFEFMEFQNTGTATIGLAGMAVVDGIAFDFTQGQVKALAPGETVLIVKNLAAFKLRYPGWEHMKIAGAFQTYYYQDVKTLSDAGERIRIEDGLGRGVMAFEYQDSWYPSTDGAGFSLTFVDPAGPMDRWNQRAGWAPSGHVDGTPGNVP